MSRAVLLLAGLALAATACEGPPAPAPRYVVGDAWQADGVWHYPRESLDRMETGLAATYSPRHASLTTDGEAFDPDALAAAHQTLQMPAIVQITNLETGLRMLVRINDRGPAAPNRILAVTPRVASLLGFGPDGTARIRLQVLQEESRAAAEAVQGGQATRLDMATAPRQSVRQSDLAPPPGIRQGAGRSVAPNAAGTADAPATAPSAVILNGNVTRVAADPGALWIHLGSFSRYEFANMQRARLGGLDARIQRIRVGRGQDFLVKLGPYGSVRQADAALAQTIRAGITDGRIVIE